MITFSRIGKFGRLGNQLFQISAAIGLAKKNNDVAKFNKWEYSKYFKNPIDQGLDPIKIENVYTERGFNYYPIPYSKNLDLLGYFQSEKYFQHCSSVIREHFDFVDDLKNHDLIKESGTCSIHVRRGDYLNLSDYHPFPGEDYYLKSVNYMKEKGVKKFYVFSDDMDWCVRFFSWSNDFVFMEGNSDIEDLCLMSLCENHIIANSSFSWWGAWLNKRENKKVISPSIWFGPAKKGVITEDLYCTDWLRF